MRGAVYTFIPRHSGLSWLGFGASRQADKAIEAKLAVLTGNNQHNRLSKQQGSLSSASDLFHFPGQCLLYVEPGVETADESPKQADPYVFATKTAVVCLWGSLYNLEELVERVSAFGSRDLQSLRLSEDGLLEGCDRGQLSAEVLLRLYLDASSSPAGHEQILLELQGSFAFLIYDSQHKEVLAARDPGGTAPLFFCVHADKSTSITNHYRLLPPGLASSGSWQQVPPGHFISGRPSVPGHALQLHQFALTPEELSVREYQTDLETKLERASVVESAGCKQTSISKDWQKHSRYSNNSASSTNSTAELDALVPITSAV